MKEMSSKGFGLVIAFLLPGFIGLWGVSYVSPVVMGWITQAHDQAPTVGGFLYVTLASLAVGQFISAVRWALIDTLHHRTGVRPPNWNFSNLQGRLAEFESLVENHYRYYQCYANALVATVLAYVLRLAAHEESPFSNVGLLSAVVLATAALVFASRDALKKYYKRGAELLAEKGGTL